MIMMIMMMMIIIIIRMIVIMLISTSNWTVSFNNVFECVIWSPPIWSHFNFCLLYVVSSYLLKNPGTVSWPFPVLLEYWSSHMDKKSP